jgi:periplasmic divalent cation tolerance protein
VFAEELNMTDIMVFITAATRQEAQKIARSLLDKHLIACANILGPVESQFWWQGKIDEAKEFLVLMKSNERLFEKLSKTIKEMHSYEVPEILALPIVKGGASYLEWLTETLHVAEQ